ncbi:50S ribosomal protein L6 [Candidatus Daviesbacteria bacterium]|nr:50S ribosomal protein L6 [Candidatus Daviesbacteria bacterium]
MSRIGNNPILIPLGVDVNLEGNLVIVKGSKGTLSMELNPAVKVDIEDGKIKVSAKKGFERGSALHGLTRSLISNMVVGVSTGWTRDLEMVGVGYRVQGGGESLTLNVGFSHPVIIKAPEGIIFTVADNTKIKVSGADKILVGQVAANIRKVRPPEVYQGKGIRYTGEYVRKKAGKAGKAATGAAAAK